MRRYVRAAKETAEEQGRLCRNPCGKYKTRTVFVYFIIYKNK